MQQYNMKTRKCGRFQSPVITNVMELFDFKFINLWDCESNIFEKLYFETTVSEISVCQSGYFSPYGI